MAHTDDGKLALAALKLAEAQRLLLAVVDRFLLLEDEDGDDARTIADLIDSADRDARNVDNGALRDYEVKP